MCFFSSPKVSAPPPVVAPPSPVDTSKVNVQARAAGSDEERRALLARGMASTIQTSAQGALEPVSVQRPTLLGG